MFQRNTSNIMSDISTFMFILCFKKSRRFSVALLILIIIIMCYIILIYILNSPGNNDNQFIANIRIIEGAVDLIQYTTNNNSNKFNKYFHLKPNELQCKHSIYKINKHQCCAVQFSMNYLYSLGFTEIDELKRRTNTKTMRNNNNNQFGCYALNIEHRNQKQYSKTFKNLAEKTSAYSIIMQYCTKQNIIKYCNLWMPATYNLFIQNERISFFKQLPCSNESNNQWIIKSNKHSGSGIFFMKNINQIRSFYLSKEEQTESNPECVIDSDGMNSKKKLDKDAIAQELISGLKLKNCNFVFRVWLMLANYNDPLILLYIDTMILRSMHPKSITTNRHNRDWNTKDNWNLQQFMEYFEGKDDKINVRNIIEQIKNISGILIKASLDTYVAQITDIQHYNHIALDIMLTEDYQLKFLDFNSGPGTSWVPKQCFKYDIFDGWNNLNVLDIWQCKFAKRMMEEMIDIQIEIAIRKQNKQKIDQIDSINTFQVILWE
eukprot:79945_1